jgi:uncharacterized membrane protein
VRELLRIVVFSHHAPEEEHKCVRVPGLPPLCSRCLGIYPVMLVVLVLQLAGQFDLAWTDPWLALLLPLPTVVEFLGEQLGRWKGSNTLRLLLGLPLGIAMARLFVRYLRDPFDPFFWAVIAVYGGTCGLIAAFVLRRRLASGRDP